MTATPPEGAKMLKISNSEIQTFKDCRRKWWLVYYRELGLKRVRGRASARDLGTKVHIALESIDEPNVDPVQVLRDLYRDDKTYLEEQELDTTDLLKEADLANAMLTGFLEWRAETGFDDGVTVVAKEAVIETPLPDVPGVMLRGKLDQRVHRQIDGAHLFRDWKTVGSLTDPPKMLPLDEQMKFYSLLEYLDALEKTGEGPPVRTDGGQYVMLRKVKRTAAAKPPFYDAVDTRYNMAELRSMWKRVVRICREIVQLRIDLAEPDADHQYLVPPRPSRDCTWKCDFFPVCPMFDDGSNVEGLLNEYYIPLDPHERYRSEDEVKP